MIPGQVNSDSTKTTSYKVVLPFYIYAALSFLSSAILLLCSAPAFLNHYFNPEVLAITHTMALGWGTMIILGASHQLVPVLIEGKLFSNTLAYLSFVFGAIGIPILVYASYQFQMGTKAQIGGTLVLLSIACYLINIGISIFKSRHENIHAVYIFTSVVWLFLTGLLGLSLVFNFTLPVLKNDSLHYLPLHAHLGIIGWFLLLVTGVGSRLIPMFLISKYQNSKLLKWIFGFINSSLILYILLFYVSLPSELMYLSWMSLVSGILMFIYFCYKAYNGRIRKKVDHQMKMSLLSVLMILIPVILLLIVILFLSAFSTQSNALILTYGFLVLFGWITAIIFGMTFKTLPFIVWNKIYHLRAFSGQSPNPKDLFDNRVFQLMTVSYLAGMLFFVIGCLGAFIMLLKIGALLILGSAVLYVINVLKVVTHKPVNS